MKMRIIIIITENLRKRQKFLNNLTPNQKSKHNPKIKNNQSLKEKEMYNFKDNEKNTSIFRGESSDLINSFGAEIITRRHQIA